MDEQRLSLEPYLDQRVEVEAVFERLSKARGRDVYVALMQDAIVRVDGSEIDLGHLWVQHAETFSNIEAFQRLTFLARVGKRKRVGKDGRVEDVFNLSFPTEVKPKQHLAFRYPGNRLTEDSQSPCLDPDLAFRELRVTCPHFLYQAL